MRVQFRAAGQPDLNPFAVAMDVPPSVGDYVSVPKDAREPEATLDGVVVGRMFDFPRAFGDLRCVVVVDDGLTPDWSLP